MLSRAVYSSALLSLMTALACARQMEPEDPEVFDDPGESGGTGGSGSGGSKAGMPNPGVGGMHVPQGGSSSLPPAGSNKSGSKNTGGIGGTAGSATAGSNGEGGDDGGTVHMPVVGMSVQFKAQDASESPVDFLGGELSVINDTAQPFDLASLKVRYYFTNEITSTTPSFIWQWGQFGPQNNLGGATCSGEVVKMPSPKPGADSYVEFSCSTTGELSAGTKLVMSWKVGAQGMGKLLQGDDYSFSPTLSDNEKIVVLNGNIVVWGLEP